jgi:hypothetical protein
MNEKEAISSKVASSYNSYTIKREQPKCATASAHYSLVNQVLRKQNINSRNSNTRQANKTRIPYLIFSSSSSLFSILKYKQEEIKL